MNIRRKNIFQNPVFIAVIAVAVGAVAYFIQRRPLLPLSDVPVVTGITAPEPTNGLTARPDLPLVSVPGPVVSVKFVIEHRSALSGKTLTVRGVVVASWLDSAKCPPQNLTNLLCPQPRIFLADSASADRDPYDLQVSLDEALIEKEAKNYRIGQMVEIKGTVIGDKTMVSFVKLYH